jgi:hypothetical protein
VPDFVPGAAEYQSGVLAAAVMRFAEFYGAPLEEQRQMNFKKWLTLAWLVPGIRLPAWIGYITEED